MTAVGAAGQPGDRQDPGRPDPRPPIAARRVDARRRHRRRAARRDAAGRRSAAPQLAFMNPGGIRGDMQGQRHLVRRRGARRGHLRRGVHRAAVRQQPGHEDDDRRHDPPAAAAAVPSGCGGQTAGASASCRSRRRSSTSQNPSAADVRRQDRPRCGSTASWSRPTDSFRVTMNNFLATGGDGFTVFNEGTERPRRRAGHRRVRRLLHGGRRGRHRGAAAEPDRGQTVRQPMGAASAASTHPSLCSVAAMETPSRRDGVRAGLRSRSPRSSSARRSGCSQSTRLWPARRSR